MRRRRFLPPSQGKDPRPTWQARCPCSLPKTAHGWLAPLAAFILSTSGSASCSAASSGFKTGTLPGSSHGTRGIRLTPSSSWSPPSSS